MSDYHTKKHKLIDAVSAELQHLRPHEIEKVLRWSWVCIDTATTPNIYTDV